MARNNIFNKIAIKAPRSNNFDLSHDHKTTMNMGDIVPILTQECVPGDHFNLNISNLIRFSPLVAPVMHRMKIKCSVFFVPNRIIYEPWEKFILGGQDPSSAPTLPWIPNYTVLKGSIANYMGLPLGQVGNETRGTNVSALPFAAYYKIWYDWYRDQNLQDIPEAKLVEGEQGSGFATTFAVMRKRAWGHDYFTSCLPFAQKGAAVSIPIDGTLTGTANVYLNDNTTDAMGFRDAASNIGIANADVHTNPAGLLIDNVAPPIFGVVDPHGRLSVDADTFEIDTINTNINELTMAQKIQMWLEKNARAGTRYIEGIRAHFGVAPRDERLDRPELIGSYSQDVVISEVLQTSNTDEDTTAQGNMAGHGIAADRSSQFSYTAKEHGFLMVMCTILPETAYSQGIEKMWTRENQFDFLWPDLAHLGEQAVLNREVYRKTSGTAEEAKEYNEGTFGYMPRYAEYRFRNNITTGEFAAGQSLDYWTMAREFDDTDLPHLNESFIVADPTKRIFAVTAEDEHAIMAHFHFKLYAKRKLPKYGTPIH